MLRRFSTVNRQASGVRRQASGVRRQASGVASDWSDGSPFPTPKSIRFRDTRIRARRVLCARGSPLAAPRAKAQRTDRPMPVRPLRTGDLARDGDGHGRSRMKLGGLRGLQEHTTRILTPCMACVMLALIGCGTLQPYQVEQRGFRDALDAGQIDEARARMITSLALTPAQEKCAMERYCSKRLFRQVGGSIGPCTRMWLLNS